MNIERQNEVLLLANNNIRKLFPKQFVKPITHKDIELVYDRNVLSIGVDAKTKKGNALGYMTGVMYLAPAKLSGINICPMASKGCAAACLFSAGRGAFLSITRQRVIKTLAYHFDETRFIDSIKKSIKSLIVKAKNKSMIPVVRLNGTSDILWERTDIMTSFPDTQFYDYTKIAKRLSLPIPSNYHLTLSLSESNDKDAEFALNKGYNVAAVFKDVLPSKFLGHKVINGDETDLRFLDKSGSIVGLKAKGKAKKDTTGFVRSDFLVESKV